MGEWAASVYEYTIGRFLALSAEGVGPPASPYPLPPLLSAEANRTHLLDMLCMCREFKTPTSHMAAQLNATQCESVQFADRWVISTDISHVKSAHVHVQVFASNGVLDVLSQYHVNPAVVANLPTSHLVNIMHPQDDVPKLDCQIGTLFLHNDVSHDHLHASFVYGDLAWNQLVHTPYSSHVQHGRVWSQTHGICIDNDLNDPMAFAVDSVAQSSSSQALATLVGGGLVLVAIKMLARWRK
ncbi:hypothetical protein DYB35_003879 [Aphanomyces astaci]|uniref:Uncharacterized protein n=1 Tax=Aphanomyces astaci TaxID=112090 RepID=A0A3R6WIQ9_APHAT|nr:hypothetical protein DYB35_003879 [Aphanomyces astaci]